jgi:hypothetical protein
MFFIYVKGVYIHNFDVIFISSLFYLSLLMDRGFIIEWVSST